MAGLFLISGMLLGFVGPSWAAGVPKDLRVPHSWIEGAKREGKVVIYGSETPREGNAIARAFNKRYPFITVEFTKAPTLVRFEKVLFAAEQGKPIVDLVTAIGGSTASYVDSGVLMDLSDLPVWKDYPREYKLKGKYLAGPFVRHWGLAYNTGVVSKNEVPASWADLLQPKWKGKVAANSITGSVTFTPLWYAWGGEKTTGFLKNLLGNGLQLRREGETGSLRLLEAREYPLLITVSAYRAHNDQEKHAPENWVALNPLPTTTGGLVGALKGAPHPNAVRIYVNWLMSKEGQKAYARATGAFPIHPALENMTPNFKDWARRIAGKKMAIRTLEEEYESTKPGSPITKTWKRLVLKGL